MSERYFRHMIVPEVGAAGQKRLTDARVLLVGVGGLGSAVLYYLAAVGVGTIGIADFDAVSMSNLQRQILYSPADCGSRKISAAHKRISVFNPDITIQEHPVRVTADNVQSLIGAYDMVVDATDTAAAKYLIHDACVHAGRPLVHAGVSGWQGHAMVVRDGSACLRCAFPQEVQEPFSPDHPRPIMGAVAGLLGQIQAIETIKVILGAGESLIDRMLFIDALSMRIRTVAIKKDPACRVCGAER